MLLISNASTPVLQVQQPKIKLTPFKLETFDEKTEHFPAFSDALKTLIHNNKKLDDVSKFLYLRTALSEEPLRVIHSLEVVSSNYEAAWSLLKKRYQNKKLMIYNHI